MQRRSFLKRLFGVAAAAVVSEQVIPDDGVALHSIAHPFNPDVPNGAVGFYKAVPVKAEGSAIVYDHLNAFEAIRDGVTKKLLGPLERIEIELDDDA